MPKTALEKVQSLNDWGHFKNPDFPDTHNIVPADLPKLAKEIHTNELVRQGIASWQGFDINFDVMACVSHNREIQPDGIIGPATEAMFETPRCGCPDWGPGSGIHVWDEEEVAAAIGRGHWARCHGAANHHKAVGRCVGTLTSHLTASYQGARMIDAVLNGVRRMYGEIGHEWVWDWSRKYSQYQTEVRFGRWAGGWIGLAQVPSPGRSCSAAPLWAQHQNNFLAGSTQARIYRLWLILIAHELGHNCSSGHTRGGPMNPSIQDLPGTWVGTPSESLMRALFGGEPVPGWPNFDGTDTPPGEILTWENIRHPLTFPDGSTEYYDITVRGPRMPAAGYGVSNWLWHKGIGDPIRMQILFQPRMSEANGYPLKAV